MGLKYIEEFRDPELARELIKRIQAVGKRELRFMEVCGTHTMSIFRHGVRSVLPEGIKLLSGPGCPVCVTAQKDIDAYVAFSRKEDVIVTTFGDLMKVPGSGSTLAREKAGGADVRIVYSIFDALTIAKEHPEKEVVFCAVGFETTIPTIAAAVLSAKAEGVGNFSIYAANKLTPPALAALMEANGVDINGFILPGHVSVITGTDAYRPTFEKYDVPSVITGFEPVDILQSVLLLIEQNESGTPELINAYPRAVADEGNVKAKTIMNQVFELSNATWRGIGEIPDSGMSLRDDFSAFDAARKFNMTDLPDVPEPKGCACGEILMGLKTPEECKLYKKVCTPMSPVGPCMVSSEGLAPPTINIVKLRIRSMTDNDKVLLDHGSGGKVSHAMFSELILPLFDNPELAKQDDGAVFEVPKGKMAFSTDSYVVDPVFFPGGDIGELAVNGTVNDVAMCGAVPLYISVGLIIEEGLPVKDLKAILESMAAAAKKAGVKISTGDTKVVPRGKADKIFINTSGVGVIPEGVDVSGDRAKPGDKVIVSGTIADHGITILSEREGLKFDSDVKTDSAPLNHMVKAVLDSECEVHVLRDPTRGGLGTTLNEIAGQSSAGIRLFEDKLPVRGAVQGTCELLGFDPLYVANEGKLIAIVPAEDADQVLEIIKQDEFGKDAVIVGEVTEEDPGRVILQTLIGGTRIVDMLTGEQLPRIC